ncbi:MAG: universal stress protein [Chloroflexi bacterium]|nr:universal stress protein [Chloroflexota bacterium]
MRNAVGPSDRRTTGARELLVPFDDSWGATRVLRRACRTARRDGESIAVLCMAKLPPDENAWGNPDLDRTAMTALTRAQSICREEGVVGVFKLNYARDLAGAIVDEARRSGAVLICMSIDEYADYELGESALMSETVQTVLAAAPCSVLLEDPTLSPRFDADNAAG